MLLFGQVFGTGSTWNFTGISSNRWTCLFILIGSGNLYPLLHGSVVVSGRLPNTFPERNSKHNLEPSLISRLFFSVRVFCVNFLI